MSGGHIILVDASGFAFRAFYSFPAYRRESDGQPRGAVIGFMAILWKMLGAARADSITPTHGAAVFDAPGPNFRHKLFPAYKSNRDPARALELEDQLPIMRPVADVLGLHPIELAGFEADDVIATLAHQARAAGMLVTIVSSDKDFGQLVEDGKIEIVDPMAQRRVLSAGVTVKFGVPPVLVPDVQALAGDAVDNIPGLAGCGLETAGELVRSMGGIDKLLKDIGKIRKPAIRAQLKNLLSLRVDGKGRAKLVTASPRDKDAKTGAEWVKLFRRLAALRTDLKLPVAPGAMALQPIERGHIEEMMKALGATAHMEAVFRLDPKLVRIVDAVPEAGEMAWWAEELKYPGQRMPELPQSGFYKRRLVRHGPYVACRIWREAETDPFTGSPTGKHMIRCLVGGEPKDPFAEWARLSMAPIPRGEYDFEVADADHAKKWRAGDPKATPKKPIDLLAAPVSQNPQKPKRRTA